MANPKLPVEIIEARGKTNLSKSEIEERRKSQLVVPYNDISPPRILSKKKQKEEFMEIGLKLVELNIMSELDEHALARYILAKEQYEMLTKQLHSHIRKKDYNLMLTVENMQNKAFNQCRMAASDLGLTITSRVRLVIPVQESPQQNKFIARFGGE